MNSSSLFQYPAFPAHEITQEQFNNFHTIDRELFARLLFQLRRDINMSTQVMGLFLWLESLCHCHLVDIILKFSKPLLEALYNEAVLCIKAIENETFSFSNDKYVLLVLEKLVKKNISLRFFYNNRVDIKLAVEKNVRDVCHRAFCDIVQQVHMKWEGIRIFEEPNGNQSAAIQSTIPPMYPPFPSNGLIEDLIDGRESHVALAAAGHDFFSSPTNPINDTSKLPSLYCFYGVDQGNGNKKSSESSMAMFTTSDNDGASSSSTILHQHIDPFDLKLYHQVEGLSSEFIDSFGQINLSHRGSSNKDEVPPDERTIFLTFSKGYPISEAEVWDFITRSFGNVIETIHMQEVPKDEQPLYARLVVRNPQMINVILGQTSKAKFSINGKHVWGRKYVHKSPKSENLVTTTSMI